MTTQTHCSEPTTTYHSFECWLRKHLPRQRNAVVLWDSEPLFCSWTQIGHIDLWLKNASMDRSFQWTFHVRVWVKAFYSLGLMHTTPFCACPRKISYKKCKKHDRTITSSVQQHLLHRLEHEITFFELISWHLSVLHQVKMEAPRFGKIGSSHKRSYTCAASAVDQLKLSARTGGLMEPMATATVTRINPGSASSKPKIKPFSTAKTA